jgi:hypothetical protein
MPAPGLPDWIGPGAIVRRYIRPGHVSERDHEPFYVLLTMELQGAYHDAGRATTGAYAFVVCPLDYERRLVVTDIFQRQVVNLPTLLSEWRWTGEYLGPNGNITMTGTSMPVTMHARAIQRDETVEIQGAGDMNGAYNVESVGETRIVLERMTYPRDTPTIGQIQQRAIAEQSETRDRLMRELLGIEDGVPSGIDHFEDPDPDDPEVYPEPAQPDADALTVEEITAMFRDPVDNIRPRTSDVNGAAVPAMILDVEPYQVWRLPPPNEGLWRVTIHTSDPRNPVILVHTREADRRIRCSATWLSEHGVRHEPPDSRTQNQPSPVVIGTLWEIPPEHLRRYRQVARWRVTRIDHDRVLLMSADGSGKRVYWPVSRLQSVGTFVGDGVPRRTAYERILHEDDDGV